MLVRAEVANRIEYTKAEKERSRRRIAPGPFIEDQTWMFLRMSHPFKLEYDWS